MGLAVVHGRCVPRFALGLLAFKAFDRMLTQLGSALLLIRRRPDRWYLTFGFSTGFDGWQCSGC